MDFFLSHETYTWILRGAFVYAGLILVGALFYRAPYGRFGDAAGGIGLPPRVGWFLMELPATVSFVVFFLAGRNSAEAVPLFFLGVWLVHYGNRGFVFPLLMRVQRGARASFGWLVIGAGWLVTTLHGYLNAVWVSEISDQYSTDWFTDPRFLVGMAVYVCGFVGNLHSDHIIRTLRTRREIANGDKVYRIPRGGLFRWVTSPSYLTEIVSFVGLAIAMWSPAACFVLLVTVANLVPRAFQTHAWYRERFGDEYPPERRALVPGLL
ncbi:MAG TPA: 3-oxo-5-alpha-steroid 4-dehydrogenase [Actinomycetales bacterium]|nr:3-oxo-5-alpha-steroid 4-dehydrogenase [Actinomycetales bacterium]